QGGMWWVDATINPRKKKPSKHVMVGTGADNYPEGQAKMPLTVVTFYVKGPKGGKPGLDKVEFDRQLKLQEDAIKAMVIQTWIGNRNSFDKGGRESFGDYDIKKLKEAFEEQLRKGGKPQRPPASGKTKRLAELFDLAQQELQRMKLEQLEKD